jgi:hypothetical protein
MRAPFALACTALFLAANTPAFGAEPVASVSGRVLLDSNGNGKIDAGDNGLADVYVSDGVAFARTAADGSYTLKFADDPLVPYKPAQVLAVSWPSGTWPVGRRYWVRRSDLKAGESVDFLLNEMKQALPFTFAHGTDPHDNVCGGDGFRDDIARMGDPVKFCIMTGDLGYATRDSAEKMFTSLRDATQKFPVPLLHAPGNHDICDIHTTKWTEQDPLAGYGPYTKYLGPLRYSFTYAGVHFVALDWARINEKGELQTGTPDAVIEWVKRDLANQKPGTRTFVFMHHDFRHGDDSFWDVLLKHKVELVIAGHSHRNKEETRRGIQRLTTQNLCGPYRLITVRDAGHDIVNRCFTGTAAGHAHSYAGQCKMALPFAPLAARRGAHTELAEKVVKDAVALDGFKAREFDLLAEVDPGTAKRFGVRIGTGADARELALTRGDGFEFAGVHSFATRARADKLYRVRVVSDGGKILVQVNNRIEYEGALAPKEAAPVVLFAEGGAATFNKVEAWELKPAK